MRNFADVLADMTLKGQNRLPTPPHIITQKVFSNIIYSLEGGL